MDTTPSELRARSAGDGKAPQQQQRRRRDNLQSDLARGGGAAAGPDHHRTRRRGHDSHKSVTNSRESIRKKLASWTDHNEEAGNNGGCKEGEEEGGNNLMVCFMNEALLDEEKEAQEEVVVDEEEAGSSDEEEEEDQGGVVEKISASYIAKNNISRKKNHVIIPLNGSNSLRGCFSSNSSSPLTPQELGASKCVVEEEEEQQPEAVGLAEQQRTEAETLSLWLLQIQVDAREKLKAAKSAAKILAASEKEQRQLNIDLERLFGLKMNRKLNRQFLTDRNIAQLQVILNYLLTRIEELNEKLVQILMTRDDLAMEQDSLLTDIEDITKGIAAAN